MNNFYSMSYYPHLNIILHYYIDKKKDNIFQLHLKYIYILHYYNLQYKKFCHYHLYVNIYHTNIFLHYSYYMEIHQYIRHNNYMLLNLIECKFYIFHSILLYKLICKPKMRFLIGNCNHLSLHNIQLYLLNNLSLHLNLSLL